ncbi:MAG: radical SAM protein [bacterium]|nr:radical SAM protein [bacterium]
MHRLREVVIETTKQCNLNCIHCGSDCGHKTTEDELSVEEWRDVLLQLSEMKVGKVVFSGGEPTLKDGFETLLAFASVLGLKVGFISNGLFAFSESLQEVISRCNPFAVGLSIDGLKQAHNKIRKNQNSWQGLMQNISILQNLGVQICVVTTLHKLNYHELPRLASFLDLVDVDSWQLQLAMPSGRMKNQVNLLINEDDFKKICREVLVLRKFYPNINIQSADCFGLAPENSIRSDYWAGCPAGISAMAIDACGNIMPCLSLQDSQRCENIKNKPIVEIWEKSSGFDFNRKFTNKNVKGRCENCKLLSECRGGCNSQSFSYYGYFHSSPFCFTRSFYQ